MKTPASNVKGKYERSKRVLEGKSLRVKVEKTKGLQLLCGRKVDVSKVNPCSVCGEQVGCNSFWCLIYQG